MSNRLNSLLTQLVKLHPKYIDLSLKRLIVLLNKLNNPHLNLPTTIHIAGTNGKGSTLSYIRDILIENNYNIHAYISPHLERFNERIILKNKEIKTKKLLEALSFVKKINNNNPITFFEIITATAFYLFAKDKVDFLILETGLGGRLDATNVIRNNLISIITPIGIDHQEFLGKELLKISNEKLGIIKKNSTIIISKQKVIVKKHILQKLKIKSNKKIFFGRDFKITKKNKFNFKFNFKDIRNTYSNPKLNGDHQIENVSTALATIKILSEVGYKFDEKKINSGILKTKWPGRLERGAIQGNDVYLDGAHNIDGAKQILKYFKQKKIKLWAIIGMLNNKNLEDFLLILKPILKGVVGVKIPKEKNSFKAKEIIEIAEKLKIKNCAKNSINSANNYLLNKKDNQKILITGSLYLIGKVRKKYL